MTASDILGELIKYADLPGAAMVVLITMALKPWLGERWFAGDRIMVVPLFLGIGLAVLLEATTNTFNVNVAIRRAMATGCGAAYSYRFAKVFGPDGKAKETPR